MGKKEFSMKEQVDCIERQIRLNETILLRFLAGANIRERAALVSDIECLKAVRKTLQFEHMMEQWAKGEISSRAKETKTC